MAEDLLRSLVRLLIKRLYGADRTQNRHDTWDLASAWGRPPHDRHRLGALAGPKTPIIDPFAGCWCAVTDLLTRLAMS